MKRNVPYIVAIIALLAVASFIEAQRASASSPTISTGLQYGPIKAMTLSRNSVVGGTALTGTVTLKAPAPDGGLTVYLSTSPEFDPTANPASFFYGAATVPSSVQVQQGQSSVSFQITTFPIPVDRTVTIWGSVSGYPGVHPLLTVQPLQVATLVIAPPAGIGPFQATGTVTLNAPAPSSSVVSLTSSKPEVVRFGTVVSAQASSSLQFQQNQNMKTFQIVASRVSQITSVTISATLQNGNTVSRAVTVRP